MKRERRGGLWAIVLAAGEGTRLASLTQAMHGRALPKQFASLFGDRTFLQRTVDRIAPLVPAHRTVVVVGAEHVRLARLQLAAYPGVEIVAQPANRGTGAGVLLPLAHVLARDSQARVVVFPSDHHVSRERAFCDAVARAVKGAEQAESGLCLVGAAAETPATDLGWIACGGPFGLPAVGARTVSRFVEKPDESVAIELLRSGSLWNTMVLAARGPALLELARLHVPAVVSAFAGYRGRIDTGAAATTLARIYTTLPTTDLSRDILERAGTLTAVAMVDAGWSDCGTPDRLMRALQGTEQLPVLLSRLGSASKARAAFEAVLSASP